MTLENDPNDSSDNSSDETSKEEADYYIDETGLLVFTRSYHLKRGYCCKNGCRHCPYGNTPKQR